jgi:hypothetical protein
MRRFTLMAVVGLTAAACNEYEIKETEETLADVDQDAAPDIAVDPVSISFDDVLAYDDGSAPPLVETRTVTITNEGEGDLHLGEILLEDTTGPYSWSNLSAILIQPGGEATFTVEFDPNTAGEVTNKIFINSDDPDEPVVEVEIFGNGIAPVIELTPSEFNFGTLYIGCDADETFTVTNIGTADLVVSDIAFNTASEDLIHDLNEATNGPLPWTLSPGEEKQVTVSNIPYDEFQDIAYLMVDSNDPYTSTVMSTIEGTGLYFGKGTDVYEQPIKGTTDIIFAVDRSCSMYDDIENVQNNFDIFVDTMDALDADYHVAATVEDNGCINGSDLYIDRDFDPADAKATITTMINLGGSYGSNTERGFMLLESCLANIGSGDCNDGLIRDDATLNLVGVSDEPEQSVNNYTYYISLFQSLKDDPDDVIMHAIGGDYPSGCGSASAYTGFYEATVATGGLFLSICAVDWGSHLEDLAEGSTADLSSFALTQYPVPETIEIEVDGTTTTIGWTYNPSTNSIDFDSDYVPEGGSTIVINYALFGDCDE